MSLVFKADHQDVIDFYASQRAVEIPGVPSLDPRYLVDGERAIQFLKPLPVTSDGRDFELRETVLGVYDKGKAGTVVKSEISLMDVQSRETYCRIVGSLFYVGQGGWGGPRGPKGSPIQTPERAPDGILDMHISEEAAHLYRYVPQIPSTYQNLDQQTAYRFIHRLNGDYNPLHGTPEPGKAMGFGGIIIHGVYAYNRVAHDLLHELGQSDASNIREFQAKFAGIVKPGDHLQTAFFKLNQKDGEWQEIRFVSRCVNREGKMCLSDGRALIRTGAPGRGSKL